MLDQLRGHRLAGTFVALQSLFRFAKGHRLIFHDSDSKSGIVIRSSNDKLNVSINETDLKIGVRSDGTIEIEATGNISVKTDADITIKSSKNITIEASAQLTLKGATVAIN